MSTAAQLKDRLGRTFADLVAQGKKIIPSLSKTTGLFMPRGGRKAGVKKSTTKTKMETPSPSPSPAAETPANAPEAAQATPPPAPPTDAPPAAAAASDAPDFSDIKKILEAEAEPAASPTGIAIKNADEYTLAAAGIVSGISTAAILALGAHAKPTDEQSIALVEAYAASFRHYGYKPTPSPWLAPVLVTATVFGPHLADSRSQDNLQKWKRRLVNAWCWVRGKFDARAATRAAQSAQS